MLSVINNQISLKMTCLMTSSPQLDSRWFFVCVIGLLTLAPVKISKIDNKYFFLNEDPVLNALHLNVRTLSPLWALSPLLAFVNVALLALPGVALVTIAINHIVNGIFVHQQTIDWQDLSWKSDIEWSLRREGTSFSSFLWGGRNDKMLGILYVYVDQ